MCFSKEIFNLKSVYKNVRDYRLQWWQQWTQSDDSTSHFNYWNLWWQYLILDLHENFTVHISCAPIIYTNCQGVPKKIDLFRSFKNNYTSWLPYWMSNQNKKKNRFWEPLVSEEKISTHCDRSESDVFISIQQCNGLKHSWFKCSCGFWQEELINDKLFHLHNTGLRKWGTAPSKGLFTSCFGKNKYAFLPLRCKWEPRVWRIPPS